MVKLRQDQFIVFLDIDGVLNSQDFFNNRRKDGDVPELDIDEKSIKWLNDFVSDRGLVVISSTWKLSFNLKQFKDIFGRVGFTGEIIGTTPNIKSLYGKNNRVDEIKKWLVDNMSEQKFDRYVIFDDNYLAFMNKHIENYFEVDNYFGISPNVFLKAKHFLKKKLDH
jgi:hypothetical protein